jgi:hypothetical protein
MNRLVAVSIAGILAACSGGKNDTSDAPFAPYEEGKEDSLNSPARGSDVRVGEVLAGKFTASRGWISHRVELAAGPVTIDLSGEEAGWQQDTVLYVFGPKKANGQYPKDPIAMNDDRVPGEDLGSSVTIDAPQAGLYRIVVSTYDNWLSYPKNVSRGTYELVVKCGLDAFDACGPAVSDLGGQCWDDGDCLASTGESAHCEGEIVCAPGTECLWVRMGACVADYAWVTVSPRQCTNEWSSTTVSAEDAAGYADSQELAQVVAYFRGKGIAIDEVGALWPSEPIFTCSSCACARGDLILVKAPLAAADALADHHGFTYLGGAVQREPSQCQSNPWQSGGGYPKPPVDEAADVITWAATLPATLSNLGFTYRTQPDAVCSGCSCPRGDRLVVVPADTQSSETLLGNGFGDVYLP